MDPLEDVFEAMRVKGAVYARVEASAPWGLSFAGGRMARFGLVAEGACWMLVEGDSPRQLNKGDCFILARGTPYVLCDDPASPRRPCSETVRDHIGGMVAVGGDGAESATVITGWFDFDDAGARPLIDLLPVVLHTWIDQDRTQILQSTLQLLNLETETPGLGSSLVVSRLADIVFVQAIRVFVRSGGTAGWLTALADHRIGNVLRAMHGEPGRHWTLETLAAVSGMSRSAFALRFKEYVGEAPLAYLTRWRMFRAGSRLREGHTSIGEIADEAGYQSEAAFNKAFKRITGKSPGLYRQTFAPVLARSAIGLAGMP